MSAGGGAPTHGEGSGAGTRRIGGIPIRNLYVMLAFGEALRGELSPEQCGVLADEELPLNILARLLTNKLGWLRRRGTPRSYRVRGEFGAAPRGSMDLPETIRGLHLVYGRVAYRVDELQMDTPQNQLLCAGVRATLRSERVGADLRDELRRQLGVFGGVSYLSNRDALRVPWRTGRGSYGEALALARLALLASLPDEGAHDEHWHKLVKDAKAMGQLFERFILGFLAMNFGARGTVGRQNFHWADPKAHPMLPQLRTDIILEDAGGRWAVVGECKLYKSPLASGNHGGAGKLDRDHLFQLYAYLGAVARDPELGAEGRRIEGLLIYGDVGRDFGTDIQLHQFPVRVRTLGLHLPWPQLRRQLVALWPRDA